MEKSNDSGPKLVEIDLNKLTIPELSRQRQQLEQVCICSIKLLTLSPSVLYEFIVQDRIKCNVLSI